MTDRPTQAQIQRSLVSKVQRLARFSNDDSEEPSASTVIDVRVMQLLERLEMLDLPAVVDDSLPTEHFNLIFSKLKPLRVFLFIVALPTLSSGTTSADGTVSDGSLPLEDSLYLRALGRGRENNWLYGLRPCCAGDPTDCSHLLHVLDGNEAYRFHLTVTIPLADIPAILQRLQRFQLWRDEPEPPQETTSPASPSA